MDKGETIFTTITRLANQYNAINLGQGFPNFAPDPRLVKIIQEVAGENIHQYAPMTGSPKLIDRIIELTMEFYNRKITAQNLLITAGATQAIFTTILALVQKDEEVIVFDPAYDCYELPIKLSGAQPIHLNLTKEDYRIDWNQLYNTITESTRMIIFNNPHNPTGSVLSQEDFIELQKLADKYPNLLFLFDEVYEYISFEKHLSVNLYPDLYERSIIVSSFGKTLHLTGWKIGYLICEESLLSKIKSIHQFNVFSVNSLSQEVIARYLDFNEIHQLSNFFHKKRTCFLDAIKGSSFKIIPTGGTYFQLLDYSEISNESDQEFAQKLIVDHNIASIPVSGFYRDNSDLKVLRFCFGKDDETLIKAGEVLCRI